MTTPLQARPAESEQLSLALGNTHRLRDTPLTKGAARCVSGRAIEEAVVAGLGLVRGKVDARFKVCFDATKDGIHFEIKSVRRGNKSPLYVWRLEKDARANVPVRYLFAEHNGRGFGSERETYEKVLASMSTVYALRLHDVRVLALSEPLRKIKTMIGSDGKRIGYSRPGYEDGYHNVPLARIAALACEPVWDFSGEVRGVPFRFRLKKVPGVDLFAGSTRG